jgi:hypothetical protein
VDFKEYDKNMRTRTEIINAIIDKYGFQSYLEIGVYEAKNNFDKINVTFKECVDPTPRGYCTYATTSDNFFENYAKRGYDVIFIDGLHTYEQSYKDVQNAMKYLNDGGFIVMHDCNPPTQSFAVSYEEHRKTMGAWMGTVYKAFIRLKNELKDWSCFVVNEDCGCGILTKRDIMENKGLDCDVNLLLWNEFERDRNKILQLITYDEYISLLK